MNDFTQMLDTMARQYVDLMVQFEIFRYMFVSMFVMMVILVIVCFVTMSRSKRTIELLERQSDDLWEAIEELESVIERFDFDVPNEE